ncbi:MAG: hypothetical protein WKG00_10155 [Polyangiaceae bacterium]
MIQNGDFLRAAGEARRFVELDPDLALARELLAQTEAMAGRRESALRQVDALAELEPRSTRAHVRAARAFTAAGDDRRACAHWRSLAELEGTPGARARAEGCVARATGSITVESGDPPPVFQVQVECDSQGRQCPEAGVVTPSGRVISRAAPFGAVPEGSLGVGLLSAPPGLYRTVLFGGDPQAKGRVHLVVHGRRATFSFSGGESTAVATTRIEERWGAPPESQPAGVVGPIASAADALGQLQQNFDLERAQRRWP